MKIAIINGPNLNLLGSREPEIYGGQTFEDFLQHLVKNNSDIHLSYFQSNVEGEIINYLHQCMFDKIDAVIINPGGYSHTSVAIADAIKAINIPVIEVHISNIYARESFRHQSLTATNCVGVISGLGLNGYQLAIHHFSTRKKQLYFT